MYIEEMNIAQRLDEAMRDAGFKTQRALSVASGIPQPTIARILKGTGKKGPEAGTLRKLAQACNVSFEWLNEGIGTKKRNHIEYEEYQPTQLNLQQNKTDYQSSKYITVNAHVFNKAIKSITVSKEWLKTSIGDNKISDLALLTVNADTMYPTLNIGDILLVDFSINDAKTDAIYAFKLNEELYVRRLQRRPDSSILMISDNKNYEPYLVKSDEISKIEILGKVLLVWNTKKL